MKRKKLSLFTAALNTARQAINAASGVYEELSVAPGETSIRYRLSPYGEFPVKDVHGAAIIQVIDRKAGETLAANYGSLSGKLATFFRGVPIYEGHADDEEWLRKNPGHRASAVGRIKTIETADDGIYVTATLNSAGIEMLGGDAPKYTGHSPHWRLAEIPGKPGYFRPILLWSDALTNTPNILQNSVALNALQGVAADDAEAMQAAADTSPDAGSAGETENQENNDDMKLTPEALAALGFAPEAEPTPDEISAAIVKLASEQAEAAAKMQLAEGETTAANSRLRLVTADLDTIRGQAVGAAITEAVNTGRITEAERPAWTEALNTSFATESAKLAKLMPTLNTTNRIGSLDRRQTVTDAANAASRITQAVTEFAVEKSIDITTPAGWTKAYDACRAAKPEIFAKA